MIQTRAFALTSLSRFISLSLSLSFFFWEGGVGGLVFFELNFHVNAFFYGYRNSEICGLSFITLQITVKQRS